MYNPPLFTQRDIGQMHRHICDNPLGLLVTRSGGAIVADHIPFELDPNAEPYGVLRGHVARANPVWREHASGDDVLVVFGGSSAYVSPSWYPSKRETQEVVPTWNYIAVHAEGPLAFFDDAARLRGHLERLTGRFEDGRAQPWSLADAPDEYIQRQLTKIVYFEIRVRALTGKWKLSQNRPLPDHSGVVKGLAAESSAAANEVGRWVDDTLKARLTDEG